MLCRHSDVIVCAVCVIQLVSQCPQGNSTLSTSSIWKTEDEGLFQSVRILYQLSQSPPPLILNTPLTIQPVTFFTINGIADKVCLSVTLLLSICPSPLAVACELAVWWKGSYHLTVYPLQEPTGKSITVCPTQHIPQASPIAHSCISEDSAMLALALNSGVVVLWDMSIGKFVWTMLHFPHVIYFPRHVS